MGSLLEQIRGPGDLRALPAEKLPELAAEIRERIIEVVGRTGGHLASNLGAVELAIALHRTFDFSRDRLVLDVGHQCYAHKMLTGRADRFATLRQKGGLSGFPQPEESEYDPFVVGHASTAISSALGLACAAEIAGEAKHVVALVGDGSMTGGLAYEGLNQAGHLKRKLLVVLNDNAMAIAPTVGALQAYLGRMRAVPFYNQMRDEFRDAVSRLPVLGRPLEVLVEKTLDAAKRVLTPGHIFYELGFRYFGPVNGHDIPGLVSALEDVKKLPGPVLLHVLTEKGRGYAPASRDPAAFHSAAPESVRARLDYEPGESSPPQKREQYTGVFSRELLSLGGADKRVVAITGATSTPA
jgi:1-deoxy-D-xylulose-5-phosphate synthase